jgi:hypothetical protein
MAQEKAASTIESNETTIQVIKEGTCPTSSGKSTLGYQVGVDESGDIHLKVASNDGGGMFSDEWFSYLDIQKAMEEWPEDQGMTSMAVRKVFRTKSANQPGFALAVLVAEGILEPIPDKKRLHQACDPAEFIASVEALQGGSSKKPKEKTKAAPKEKATPKKKAAPKVKAKTPAKATAKTAKTPRKTTRKNPKNP